MKEIAHLTSKLTDPEYLSLLIEPFMIWGLALGVVGTVLAFLFKERKAQMASLLLIIVAALMVVPYSQFRKKADTQSATIFATKRAQIEEQQTRWLEAQWVYFAVAGLAGITLLMGMHKGKPGLLVGIGTVLAGTACVFFTMWLHLKESEIYHPNLRDTSPRVTTTEGKPPPSSSEDRRALVLRPRE